jgi:TonB family protein
MRSNQRLQMAFLIVFLLTLPASAVFGQTADTAGWQELKPEGEEFSILMPKNPVVEIGKMPYHKMELNTRLYLSHNPSAATFAVVSLSGIKSNPAMYTELERMNSYVDAFKKFLLPKIAPKETVTKFVMIGPKTLNGHKGREYQLNIGGRSGTAQVFATRRRFYGVMFLATKKSDELRDQFISSFVLPEFVPRPAATTAAQTAEKVDPEVVDEEKLKETEKEQQEIANAANQTNASPGSKGEGQKTGADPESKNPDAPVDHPTGSTQRKPISGGVLNGKALSLPLPPYPPEARAANASGAVTVQVTVDEWGSVTVAKVISGHPLLQQAALAAAFQARFSPTTLMGEPVKVIGVLVYNFNIQ